MQRLHTLGMTEDDSFKLLAMRGYIFSVAIARRRYVSRFASVPLADLCP
jgi:hypothetical protein